MVGLQIDKPMGKAKMDLSKTYQAKVVLSRSLYDSNIGASSRAMTNMGAQDLILVEPQCQVTYAAQQAAASGQAPLQNRKVYSSWQEFYNQEPSGLRFCFSARDGRGDPLWDFSEVLGRLQSQRTEGENVYLIFGPEDAGLSSKEKEFAHYNVRLPTFGNNSSLNLAQAVLLALFILRTNWRAPKTQESPVRHHGAATNEISCFESTLKSWLMEIGFALENRAFSAYTVMKRVLLHNVPTKKELAVLETILQQSRRKLEEYNQLRKIKGETDGRQPSQED